MYMETHLGIVEATSVDITLLPSVQIRAEKHVSCQELGQALYVFSFHLVILVCKELFLLSKIQQHC